MTDKNPAAGMLFYCPSIKSILLLKRSKKVNNPGLWDIPGGRSTKQDQSPEQTAEREATEEIGPLPSDKKYIGKHILNNSYHIFVYTVDKEWKPQLDNESETYGWFKITKLPEAMHFHLEWLEDFIKRANKRDSKIIIKTASSIIAPRFEYKYIVNPLEANEIKEYIKPFVTADEHGQFYNIKNIYLDNKDLKLYNDHSVLNNRFKLRIRYYDTEDNAFCEIKRRANKNITKYRYIVSSPEEITPFTKIANIVEATPIILINYDREAYEGEGRVTFDSNLKYAATKLMDRNQVATHQILPRNFHVLELKFNGTMPQYMKDLVLAFDLERVPMSKYYAAVSDFIYG